MHKRSGLLSAEKEVRFEYRTVGHAFQFGVRRGDSFSSWEFQNRANYLSATLDDLKKTLYERGRALGVKPKSAVPIEVSTGTFCGRASFSAGVAQMQLLCR